MWRLLNSSSIPLSSRSDTGSHSSSSFSTTPGSSNPSHQIHSSANQFLPLYPTIPIRHDLPPRQAPQANNTSPRSDKSWTLISDFESDSDPQPLHRPSPPSSSPDLESRRTMVTTSSFPPIPADTGKKAVMTDQEDTEDTDSIQSFDESTRDQYKGEGKARKLQSEEKRQHLKQRNKDRRVRKVLAKASATQKEGEGEGHSNDRGIKEEQVSMKSPTKLPGSNPHLSIGSFSAKPRPPSPPFIPPYTRRTFADSSLISESLGTSSAASVIVTFDTDQDQTEGDGEDDDDSFREVISASVLRKKEAKRRANLRRKERKRLAIMQEEGKGFAVGMYTSREKGKGREVEETPDEAFSSMTDSSTGNSPLHDLEIPAHGPNGAPRGKNHARNVKMRIKRREAREQRQRETAARIAQSMEASEKADRRMEMSKGMDLNRVLRDLEASKVDEESNNGGGLGSPGSNNGMQLEQTRGRKRSLQPLLSLPIPPLTASQIRQIRQHTPSTGGQSQSLSQPQQVSRFTSSQSGDTIPGPDSARYAKQNNIFAFPNEDARERLADEAALEGVNWPKTEPSSPDAISAAGMTVGEINGWEIRKQEYETALRTAESKRDVHVLGVTGEDFVDGEAGTGAEDGTTLEKQTIQDLRQEADEYFLHASEILYRVRLADEGIHGNNISDDRAKMEAVAAFKESNLQWDDWVKRLEGEAEVWSYEGNRVLGRVKALERMMEERERKELMGYHPDEVVSWDLEGMDDLAAMLGRQSLTSNPISSSGNLPGPARTGATKSSPAVSGMKAATPSSISRKMKTKPRRENKMNSQARAPDLLDDDDDSVETESIGSEDQASDTIDMFMSDQDNFMGDKANKLALWQSLCIELGVARLPDSPDPFSILHDFSIDPNHISPSPPMSIVDLPGPVAQQLRQTAKKALPTGRLIMVDQDQDQVNNEASDSESSAASDHTISRAPTPARRRPIIPTSELPLLPNSLRGCSQLLHDSAHINLRDYWVVRQEVNEEVEKTRERVRAEGRVGSRAGDLEIEAMVEKGRERLRSLVYAKVGDMTKYTRADKMNRIASKQLVKNEWLNPLMRNMYHRSGSGQGY